MKIVSKISLRKHGVQFQDMCVMNLKNTEFAYLLDTLLAQW